jgi:ferredoxin-NADP reductase/MOSC domain-containing protein YiiM
MMKLLSVNVSLPKEVPYKGKTVATGIFKQPVKGRVKLRALNLDGDGQADLNAHGGPFKAVYVYSIENYAYWERELARNDFGYGQFGENFTVEGMPEEAVHIGDIFRVGSALVEVTQPRAPCFKLAITMGVPDFDKVFPGSGRVGFYLRVLEEGEVGAGDVIERVRVDPERMTVREVNNLLYFDTDDLDGARRALRVSALSPGWKESFEKRLAKAGVGVGSQRGLRTLVVDRKVPESETITSFYLVATDGMPLAPYLPGQFLTLELNISGHPKRVVRNYTLSESPARTDRYRMSIKREPTPPGRPEAPPGLSSNYFHDQVEVGTTLKARPPIGKFSLDPDSGRPVVLVSAGVGLTPLISMLNTIVERRSGRPTWFVHGARNGREHAFGAHVRRLAAEHDNVRVHVRYSRPDAEDVAGRDYDSQGRVDVELLKSLLPGRDFDFYLCGPTPFMKSLYNGLLAWGVPETRIHYEFFGSASILKDPAVVPASATSAVTGERADDIEVTFARSVSTASWSSPSPRA